jgi:formyl-CoA transferase
MPSPHASQALSRFTVLDLTRVRSGPTCVRQLADWGANVIKIDALLEDGGEQLGGPRQGADFQNLHRNKRAISLNLKDPKGLEVFNRLVAKADVVVENFRPDVKAKLGIDYESVKKINPRIVYGSISGFGQDGPYHKRPGFDQIAQGMGGLMSITGAPGQGPMRVGIPVADLTAGLFCAMGMGSRALFKRATEQAFFIDAVNTLAKGALVPVPGGVLIRDKSGDLLGAIGISGDTSDNDEASAVAGIEAAGLKADIG